MNIEQLDKVMILTSAGEFVNHSGFTDQLTKKNEKDAGLDVKAVLNGKDIDERVETIIYGSAGEVYVYDVDEVIIPPKGRIFVQVMINIAVPDGCYGRLASRSGLSRNFGIEIGAGTIDIPYRGLVGVVLHNHGFYPYLVKHGDKICQLITTKIDLRPYVEVKSLDETTRGVKGFGSSGR